MRVNNALLISECVSVPMDPQDFFILGDIIQPERMFTSSGELVLGDEIFFQLSESERLTLVMFFVSGDVESVRILYKKDRQEVC